MDKYKKTKILISLLSLGLIGCFYGYNYEQRQKDVELIFITDTLEYGKNVDFNQLLDMDNAEIIVKADGFDSKKIGEQKIKFKITKNNIQCKNKTYTFQVEDTTGPIIKLKNNSIELEFGEQFDINSNILSVTDKIDGDLEYNITGYSNFSQAGTYTLTVNATDKNGNKSTEKFTVTVKEPKVEIKTPTKEDKKEDENGLDKTTQKEEKKEKTFVVDSSRITSYSATKKYTSYFIDVVASGGIKLYFIEGDRDSARSSWSEMTDLLGVESLHGYQSDYITLEGLDISKLIEAANAYKNNHRVYLQTVIDALNKLDLTSTDKEMINQIQKYIIDTYSYEVTNGTMYDFVSTKKGQCLHFSKLFKDMCSALGFECGYVEGKHNDGNMHAWNYVVVDGKTYWFDLTFSESSGKKWEWMSEEEIRKDRIW